MSGDGRSVIIQILENSGKGCVTKVTGEKKNVPVFRKNGGRAGECMVDPRPGMRNPGQDGTSWHKRKCVPAGEGKQVWKRKMGPPVN
ncbi:MAG: hypothetical protein FD153_425 [Rhodospirillaceae bacterium]|nr:MAG: hypothetical protein FD153_425 [Rhodospirillaceae bacterium]